MDRDKLYCPYRTRSIVFHNKKDNLYIPNVGINRKIDYDAIDTDFGLCIREKCMMYDVFSESCQLAKNNFF